MESIYNKLVQLIELLKTNLGFLETVVFGESYKAYKINKKYVVCKCERKSIENKIKIYYKYFIKNKQQKYYDYIRDEYYENITLEQFLGLPKELDIDYSKDVVSQITFVEYVCHDCLGKKYDFIIKNKKRTAEILRQNTLLDYGVMYVPVAQDCFLLLDELSKEDINLLIPELKDFQVRKQIFQWDTETRGSIMVDNPYKDAQIENVKSFLSLNSIDIVQVLYGNEKHESIANFLYEQNNIDMNFLKLDKEIPYKMSGNYLYRENIKGISKRFRELCTKKYSKKRIKLSREISNLILEVLDDCFNFNLYNQIKPRILTPEYFNIKNDALTFLQFMVNDCINYSFTIDFFGFNFDIVLMLVLSTKDRTLLKNYLIKTSDDFDFLENAYGFLEYLAQEEQDADLKNFYQYSLDLCNDIYDEDLYDYNNISSKEDDNNDKEKYISYWVNFDGNPEDRLIYLSCVFKFGDKSYYYLTNDESIEVGDYVRVPVSDKANTAVVEVVGIDYFTKDNAPLSPDKVKSIIEKVDN